MFALRITAKTITTRRPIIVTAGRTRFRSSSTMSTATKQCITSMTSTVHCSSERRDFSTVAATTDYDGALTDEHFSALLSALRQSPERKPDRVFARGYEVDLLQAATAAQDKRSFDKVLILLRHGEAAHNEFERKWIAAGHNPNMANLSNEYPRDPFLTGKGVGQILNLSRRTATFCNKETGLIPDLFVVSPLRRAAQTALIAFPHYSPTSSLLDIPWICHEECMERANGNSSDFVSSAEELEQTFQGIDYSRIRAFIDPTVANSVMRGSMVESKTDLLARTDRFLEWIRGRDERVIVVSSHSTWLQSFCECSLNYSPSEAGSRKFQTGELRAIALKFD